MKTLPCLLLALPFFVTACSKDSPVGPSATTPQAGASTAVIGASGGVLSCEGFPVLTYFKATESIVSGTETETWNVEASSTCGIPGRKNQFGTYEFTARGLDVGNHIKPIDNRLEDSAINYWWQLISTEFDSNSYISIILE